MDEVVTELQLVSRTRWVNLLQENSSDFAETSGDTLRLLTDEILCGGSEALLGHLRFCGTIPEEYKHDSTAEKAYSKYTDSVIAEALKYLGLTAVALDGRADMADVEAIADEYDLVADAKAFRLTRTAKNQKDFKVASLDRWRYGKRFAVVICPIDHLPARASQIYLDASTRNVCVLSYSHLAALVSLQSVGSGDLAMDVFGQILSAPSRLNPAKDAVQYWKAINETLLIASESIADIWRQEKIANAEVLRHLKEEGLTYLSRERSRIMSLSRDDAIQLLLEMSRIRSRIDVIQTFVGNGLLSAK